jgi:hypothetical protein
VLFDREVNEFDTKFALILRAVENICKRKLISAGMLGSATLN